MSTQVIYLPVGAFDFYGHMPLGVVRFKHSIGVALCGKKRFLIQSGHVRLDSITTFLPARIAGQLIAGLKFYAVGDTKVGRILLCYNAGNAFV